MNELLLRLFGLVLFIAYRIASPGNDIDRDFLEQNKAYLNGVLEGVAKHSDD